MSLDGLCDGDCGQPATVEIQIDGESGFFCAQCAPTGPARPVGRPRHQPRPVRGSCLACGARLEFKGEDRDGLEVWRCEACDTFGG